MPKTLNNLFDAYDMFGSQPHHLTIGGKSQVGSSIGFLASIFVTIIMVFFGTLQIFIVTKGWNP